MKLPAHIAASLPLAGGVYLATNSVAAAVSAAAASVLVDLDHLPDYIYWRGGWRGVGDFFRTNSEKQTAYLFMLLHSWELLAISIGAAFWWQAPLLLKTALMGWAYHMAWDLYTNHTGFMFYFFSFRASRGFLRSELKPGG